jgi:hypothetical protein
LALSQHTRPPLNPPPPPPPPHPLLVSSGAGRDSRGTPHSLTELRNRVLRQPAKCRAIPAHSLGCQSEAQGTSQTARPWLDRDGDHPPALAHLVQAPSSFATPLCCGALQRSTRLGARAPFHSGTASPERLGDQPGQLCEILAVVRPLGPRRSCDGLGVLRGAQLGPWAAGFGGGRHRPAPGLDPPSTHPPYRRLPAGG